MILNTIRDNKINQWCSFTINFWYKTGKGKGKGLRSNETRSQSIKKKNKGEVGKRVSPNLDFFGCAHGSFFSESIRNRITLFESVTERAGWIIINVMFNCQNNGKMTMINQVIFLDQSNGFFRVRIDVQTVANLMPWNRARSLMNKISVPSHFSLAPEI